MGVAISPGVTRNIRAMKYTNTIQALQGAPRWAAQWHISGSSSPSSASPTPGKKDPSHRKVAGVEGARNKRQGGGDKQRTAAIGGLNHGSGCLLLGGCGARPHILAIGTPP